MPLVNVGQRAPAFESVDHKGERRSLKDYAGRSLVLYFYPKDETPDCAAQACQFRDVHAALSHSKCSVLGVSPDDAATHKRFAEAHALDFPLLVDARDARGVPEVADAYGVWVEKSMFGTNYSGVVRTTYLIGPDGRVAKRWDKVKVPGHAAEVRGAVDALNAGTLQEPKTRAPTAPPTSSNKSVKPAKAKSTAGKRARTSDANPPFQPLRGGGKLAGSSNRAAKGALSRGRR